MKKIYITKIKKLFKDNKGNTMLETMVSFVVLMIVLAGLYAMIRFATDLRMRAMDSSRVQSEFGDQIYRTDNNMQNVKAYKYIGKHANSEANDPTVFTLKLSDTTNISKNFCDDSITKSNVNSSIKLPNINATGYVSTNPLVDSENLVPPRVLVFEHEYHTDY